ncbi:hypothetical protein ABEQ61_12365 [Cutibacterium acnes]|uniref:hypothetical protein n=1 Tax=Herbaspirillum huttiense TaxID=863372 RepID=UPI002E76154E|nr:hypothetical protein [Herbaspirillum huttiense]MEE1639245.1 hypothetical protein [Herbaspirillum huttiense NC40101]
MMRFLTHIAILMFPIVLAHAQSPEPAQETVFQKVSDALDYLKSKPGVSFTTTKPDAWLIANDTAPFAIWSFVPQGHYAYPAVVKRELKKDPQGNVSVAMTAICEAPKEACDKLIGEFQAMNAQAAKDVRRNISR